MCIRDSDTRVQVPEEQKNLYADPNNLPADYTYAVWKLEGGIRTETTYNNKHMPKKINTVNASNGSLMSEQEITYDSYQMPISKKTTTGQVVSIETMQNDAYGNVVDVYKRQRQGFITVLQFITDMRGFGGQIIGIRSQDVYKRQALRGVVSLG